MKKKHSDRLIWKKDGYVTLFACLLFLVMTGAIFLCLDGIVIHQGEGKSKMAEIGAGEHLLANYNVPLAKRYHVYFLDPQMEGKLESRAKTYYKESFSPTSSAFLRTGFLLKLAVKNVEVTGFGTMQEQNCLYFRHQIREYMKYDSSKEILANIIDQATKQMNQQNQEIRDMKQLIGQKEESISKEQNDSSSQTPPNLAEEKGQKETALSAQKQDPRKEIHKIIKNGVLEFVTDGEVISDQKMIPDHLPSGSRKEKNKTISGNLFSSLSSMKELFHEFQWEKGANNLSDEIFTYAYIRKYFNSYKKEENIEDTYMDYEMEYLLGGRLSDKENLEYTVNRLILTRFAFDFLYAAKDPELNSKALSLAVTLVGATGITPLVEGVKYMILGAVSFGEALLDVRNLIEGRKVPLLKTKSDWNFSWNGTGGLDSHGKNESKKGLSYEEYLILLLTLRTNRNLLYLRMEDLMQVNIMQEQPGFLIENCRFGFSMKTQLQIQTWFGHGIYPIDHERTFSY